MATVSTLSVFPPSHIPRISLPNPHKRKPSLRTVETTDAVNESVTIALQEIPIPDIPKEYTSQASLKRSASEIHTIVLSPGFKTVIPPPPPMRASQLSKMDSIRDGQSSAQSSPEPGSISSAETLVHPVPESPSIVPIRSMFPVYNPSVPLSHQGYPQQRPGTGHTSLQQAPLSPPLYAHSNFGGSARGSVVSQNHYLTAANVPAELPNNQIPLFSSSQKLRDLWDMAQGTVDNITNTSFDLQLARSQEATFVVGPSIELPFYTITTFDTSEISISKTHPNKPTVNCDVVLSQIEAPSRRLPPQDGLVSFVFPKTAAMLAINQAKAYADDFDLAPTDRDDVQSEAIKKAANQEASNLRWNTFENRYELQHPALSRTNYGHNFVVSPQSPQPEDNAVLHITVIEPESASQDQPIILVTCPAKLRSLYSPIGTAMASPKSPDFASDLSLASLDFNTRTLHIEARNILEVMPSHFAIDSVVSALFTVLVADKTSNTAMAEMKVSVSKPLLSRPNTWNSSPNLVSTPKTSAFYATIAEREEAEEEARAAAKAHRKSTKTRFKMTKSVDVAPEHVDLEAGRTWYGKSKVKKQKKTKQIVIGEFDLDKLTHYQSGARQGQELPAVTRGALTVMVSSLKFVVWFLTMIVQILAWIMVSLTRGVTSERF